MKKTLLICVTLLFSKFLLAQDACADLMKFNDYQKNVNRTYRMKSTTAVINQTLIMERNKEGLMHQTVTMEVVGNAIKVESYVVGNQYFTKKNDEDWQVQTLDSVQLQTIKNQWENGQLQFFKNCKKLDDETVNGKKYRVYSAEFDPEKMKEMMGKSDAPNAEMMAQMKMNMIFYINDKDDIEFSKLNTEVMGQSFSSDMDFEYDIPITITPPTVTKKG